jgi:predicted nicotinamide N-methyase
LYAPGAPLSHPFYLHVSIPGPFGTQILPALSGPHQLFASASTRNQSQSGKPQATVAADGSDKMTYVMGEHGVHHAFFVPLDCSTVDKATGLPPSVYSLSAASARGVEAPPAFIRFKEILGVNLGGRIWDCGLLLFDYIRATVLARDPFFFHGRKVLEVGSGTGLVGLWIWAYVLLKNRQMSAQLAAAGPSGRKNAALVAWETAMARGGAQKRTEILLTDQEEAMDNLRENVATNLLLLTGGAAECDGVHVAASQLSWGDDADHASLAIQPSPRPFDLVIASDVVFNPIYFDPLLDSLDYISSTPGATDVPPTEVLMAYRPRASDRRQDEVFFKALPGRGWSAKREAKLNDVFMLTLTRTNKAGQTTAAAAAASAQNPAPAAESVRSVLATPSPSPEASVSAAATDMASSSAQTAATASASSSPAAPNEAVTTAAVPSPVAAAASDDAATDAAAAASASPSANVVAPAVATDLLSGVLESHFADVVSGAEQGQRDGLANAAADAEAAGAVRGKAMANELAFYAGFLHTCSALQSTHPSAYPERLWTRCARLRSSLLSLPLVSSGMDPMRLDDGTAIVQLRSQFKVLLSQMGFAQYFKHQQAEDKNTISF